MANDLATLNAKLATALRDTDNATWTSAELDDLLTWSAARLFPRLARSLRESVTLVDDDDQYTLSSLREVTRVDFLDSDGVLLMPLPDGTWELWGDGETSDPVLYINPVYAKSPYTLRVHGHAPYDLVTALPLDRHVPLILAIARAEAGRREITRRMNFKQWMNENQTQNVTVNELVLLVNEADAEAARLSAEMKTWRKPKPGRV